MKKVKLSPSALSILKDCPRCFWLDKVRYIKRPRGIFPSLPGGMDSVIKTYFDEYRAKNILPPELEGKIEGKLFPDIKTLEKWRSWRTTDLYYEDAQTGAVLSGALDDCLTLNGTYMPLDYKTRGSKLKSDPAIYYQTQLDSYSLMLESKGFKSAGFAYLLYYWPEEVKENGMVRFAVEPFKIQTNTAAVKKIVSDAVKILNGDIPEPSPKCEYCSFAKNRTYDMAQAGKPPSKPEPEKKQPVIQKKEEAEEQKEFDEEDGQYYFF